MYLLIGCTIYIPVLDTGMVIIPSYTQPSPDYDIAPMDILALRTKIE